MKLKSWRECITPHRNVLEGTFQEAEFAADLNKVASGTATPEYQDPVLFFERTYITEGMGLLLDSVVKRVSGKGGDPVVQLQTAFGGGKTHAILAVYHLAKSESPAKELSGIPPILDQTGVSELPHTHVSVLDGNALSPSHPRSYGSVTVNTLWGEIAWQLGGVEGYRMLEQADKDGTSPGKEILADIFRRFSPCIVLMDETVAYVRQFEEGKSYSGGTFGSNMAFLQALTESAGHVPTSMVLAALPESDMEAGGERGKQALRAIEHLFHRVEAIWKPVAVEEGFEIVRRRLFTPISDTDARDAVCRSFVDLYVQDGNYPSETQEARYFDRLKAAYPIHPEVFDRLYEDWSTLENFQRTRGVLRLMAMVVHRLWSDGNQDLMIMPGSMPLYDVQVKNELVRYLPQGWEPVVDRDVDGARATTTEIDEKNPMLGSVQAARRVARTIFLGSAPTTSGQKIRGINAEHVRVGCCQPEQQVGRFDDALRRLTDQLHYLYSGKERYWYDTQTNLRREAEDRMSRFDEKEDLVPEIERRLRSSLKGKPFSGIHVFTSSGDIPDDTQIRLVVLPPRAPHKWHEKKTQAILAAQEIQKNRGKQPRLNQNRLIFLAADVDTTSMVYSQTRRYLAWNSIVDDKDALNLDQHRLKEATKKRNESDDRLKAAISEAYRWLLSPYQEPDKKGGVLEVQWEEQSVATTEMNQMQIIIKVLEENEILISQWSPFHLKNVLELWFWREDRADYPLLNLWNDFCRYPYLPVLVDSTVLRNTVSEGAETRDFFGYATGKEGKRYVGLRFGSAGSVYMDENSLIIHPDAAKEQQKREQEEAADKVEPDTGEVTTPGIGEKGVTEFDHGDPAQKTMRRFHGSVQLNPVTASLDFAKISEEIVQHFTADVSAQVRIVVEIEANVPHGIKEHILRAVKENCCTLNFNLADFEEE